MKQKVKIESAYPQVRMLERVGSFAYEVWSWRVKYLLVPTEKGCKGCSIKEGEVVLTLTGMSYSKVALAKEVRLALDIQ